MDHANTTKIESSPECILIFNHSKLFTNFQLLLHSALQYTQTEAVCFLLNQNFLSFLLNFQHENEYIRNTNPSRYIE